SVSRKSTRGIPISTLAYQHISTDNHTAYFAHQLISMRQHKAVGIEEEYMVMDPQTRELRAQEHKIVEQAHKENDEKGQAECHQAVVQVGTQVRANVEEARADVALLRRTIAEIAGELGYSIGAAGTHPFSKWELQLINDHPRYFEIVNEMQDAARSNLIFG